MKYSGVALLVSTSAVQCAELPVAFNVPQFNKRTNHTLTKEGVKGLFRGTGEGIRLPTRNLSVVSTEPRSLPKIDLVGSNYTGHVLSTLHGGLDYTRPGSFSAMLGDRFNSLGERWLLAKPSLNINGVTAVPNPLSKNKEHGTKLVLNGRLKETLKGRKLMPLPGMNRTYWEAPGIFEGHNGTRLVLPTIVDRNEARWYVPMPPLNKRELSNSPPKLIPNGLFGSVKPDILLPNPEIPKLEFNNPKFAIPDMSLVKPELPVIGIKFFANRSRDNVLDDIFERKKGRSLLELTSYEIPSVVAPQFLRPNRTDFGLPEFGGLNVTDILGGRNITDILGGRNITDILGGLNVTDNLPKFDHGRAFHLPVSGLNRTDREKPNFGQRSHIESVGV